MSEADQERLRKLSDVRKDDDLGERERNHERRKRDYFRDEVLASTGSAVTWWLTQKDNDVGELAQLSGVSPVAIGYRALMDTAGFGDNPPALLAHEIARLFDKFGKPDVARDQHIDIRVCFGQRILTAD